MNENGLNYIDLFAGAGGLSEGFIQSGYRPVAHVEMNGYAAKTLETRIAYYYLKDNGELNSYYDYEKGKITRTQLLEKIPEEELKTVINKEMSESTIKGIFNTIDEIKKEKGIEKIDVIIGGPPCQAYSLVGRAQSSHMVVPMEDDPRNELYKMYVQFLNKYKPRMFVFENVAGIKSARGGQAFKNLQMYMKRVGYEICYDELNAHDFGVLQSRKRVIIVGWLKGTGYDYPSFEVIHSNAEVWDLLKDLPALNPGDEAREHTMKDMSRLKDYVKENNIRIKSDVLTGHIARPHTAQDIEIYKRAIDMWFENKRHERLKYDDLPEDLKTHKNRTSFVDRFKVVEGDMDHCHTILAHLSKDGHYFIHPDIEQHRSITESIRTQQYMFEELSHAGYEGQILKFNGSTNDPVTKQIYKAWKARNYGKYVGSRNVELKNAIVEAFRDEYKILLVTDSGSEGLNLQFCNTIINYDLPWNPQKIEQRIGRCHRYGQKNDVVVINLLNTQNVADKRVYEILSEKFELFQGVFGASDKAIGLLESGADFEKRVTLIYQECKTTSDFTKQFKNLEKELEKKQEKG